MLIKQFLGFQSGNRILKFEQTRLMIGGGTYFEENRKCKKYKNRDYDGFVGRL